MQLTKTVGMFGLVGLLSACTPTPQKVCEHAASVMAAGHHDAEELRAANGLCAAMLTAAQAAHPAEYKTAARCAMNASTEQALSACLEPLPAH